MAKALEELSCSKAADSAAVGGRPVRSKVARRMMERLLAGARLEILRFEFGHDEAVNFGARPFLVVDGGRLRISDGAERPEVALFGGDDIRRRCRGCGGFGGLRPDCAVLDPGFDIGDLSILEAAGGGHFEASLIVVERFDHEAVGGVAGDDDRAGLAALERVFAGIELQAAHAIFGVAGVAFVDEERTDAHFEEFSVGGGGLLSESGGEREHGG